MNLRQFFSRSTFFSLLFLCSVPSFGLKESDISMVYKLLDRENLYQEGEFKGEGDRTLRYLKFGKEKGPKGSVIFVNGRAENVFKYVELFYDLHIQGWSPVYTYDHRGQGFSERLLLDSEAGYVEDYFHYRKDLEAFLQLVSLDPEFNPDKSFLIAHSMGGVITVDYLQNNPDQRYFSSVAISSPMFQIHSHVPSLIEQALLKAMKLYCLFGCSDQLPGIKKAQYARQEYLTGSKTRHNFRLYLETKKFPEIKPGRPTYQWVIKSFEVSRQIMQKGRIQAIKTPILILQAEQDQIVSNSHQDQFCNEIPKCCYIKKTAARHEHFLETDTLRDQAIQETLSFFSKHKHYQELCVLSSKSDHF